MASPPESFFRRVANSIAKRANHPHQLVASIPAKRGGAPSWPTRTRTALFHPRKSKRLRQRQENQPKEGETNRNYPWNPDSLFRHDDGRCLRAFHEKQSGKPDATLPSGICRRGNGCRVGLEPAHSCYRAIGFNGNAFVLSRFCGILVRRTILACLRPPNPPSACRQRTVRGPKKQT